ncbi:hypothetical protein [Gordonia amicalis]|uniref:hypothetical protein n=1 Tax=Gordonia amicalis TaxID=89053 RepID=UPI003A7FBA97
MGASSFEPRCTNSLEVLCAAGLVQHILVVNYETRIIPMYGRDEVAHKRAEFQGFSVRQRSIDYRSIHAHRIAALHGELLRIGRKFSNCPIIIDVSCLTKVHAIAVAEWLSEREQSDPPVFVCYSSPESYSWDVGNSVLRGEFRELVFCPIGGMNEDDRDPVGMRSMVDVIALLGHEGGRALYAMSGIDVERGLCVLFDDPLNETPGSVARVENSTLIGRILKNKLGDWSYFPTVNGDLSDLHTRVSRFVLNSASNRQVIIPLGPKVAIVQSALAALSVGHGDIWVSYPVPNSYVWPYSYGVGQLRFFEAV